MSLADEFATTSLIGLGLVGGHILSIALDTAFVESMLSNANPFGVRLRSETAGPFNRIVTTESLTGQSPRLVVEYASAPLAGDFNGDGVVHGQDHSVWREGLGAEYTTRCETTP